MTEVLQIAQLGHPILRKIASPVENINDPTIQTLIDSLIHTAQTANGVGIAAPQVAQSYRLFIVASCPNPRYPDAPFMEPTAMINPSIVDVLSDQIKGWEGCLSVPNLRGLVPRYQTIKVEYQDRNGHLHRQIFSDFVARIIQHELDHLDGIVFLDRLDPQDLYTEQEYEQMLREAAQ
jgi:peptide deformylase